MTRILAGSLMLLGMLPVLAGTPPEVLSESPNPQVPEAVSKQFGLLVGSWSCRGSSRQPDGSWKDNPGEPRWVFYYTLDGHAVQDFWIPAPDSPPTAAPGTNLRVYDEKADAWNVAWITTTQGGFDEFTARWVEDRIVMHGERPARGSFQAHRARITFFEIGKESFDWKYEFSAVGDGQTWTEAARLACRRQGS